MSKTNSFKEKIKKKLEEGWPARRARLQRRSAVNSEATKRWKREEAEYERKVFAQELSVRDYLKHERKKK